MEQTVPQSFFYQMILIKCMPCARQQACRGEQQGVVPALMEFIVCGEHKYQKNAMQSGQC